MSWLIQYKLRNIGRKANPDKAFVKQLENRLILEAGLAKPGLAPAFRWASAASLALVVIFGATGAYAYASDDVLPGNFLYPIRQGLEAVEEKTAWQEERKLKILLKHLQKRLKEDELVMKRSGKLPDARLMQFHGQLDKIIEKTGRLPVDNPAELDEQTADLAEEYSDLTENSASTTDTLVDKEQAALKERLEKIEGKRQKSFDKVIKKIEQRKARNAQKQSEK